MSPGHLGPHPFLIVADNLNSMNPSFLFYKVGQVIAATEQDCNDNKCIKLYSLKLKAWLILL